MQCTFFWKSKCRWFEDSKCVGDTLWDLRKASENVVAVDCSVIGNSKSTNKFRKSGDFCHRGRDNVWSMDGWFCDIRDDCSTLMHIGATKLLVASFGKCHKWCSFSAEVEAAAVHLEVLVVVSQVFKMKSWLYLMQEERYLIVSVGSHLRQLYSAFDDTDITVFNVMRNAENCLSPRRVKNSCWFLHNVLYFLVKI